jgi:hypothetical protein
LSNRVAARRALCPPRNSNPSSLGSEATEKLLHNLVGVGNQAGAGSCPDAVMVSMFPRGTKSGGFDRPDRHITGKR